MTTKTATIGWAIGGLALGLSACNQKPAEQPPSANAAGTTANAPGASAGTSAQADAPGRVRGTLDVLAPNGMTVTTYGGSQAQVALSDQTKYAWVTKSSLSTLHDGDFIGTATTGPDSDLKAVEIVIFPEAMRGTGEGHYDWDTPGIVQASGRAAGADSGMTNGTVTQSAMTNGTVQQSGMTNGTVQQSGMTNGTVTGGAGARKLTVSYKGGTAQVSVPDGTPVVRFEPASRSDLAKGQKLFVKLADDQKSAQFVAMGKDGLTPPM